MHINYILHEIVYSAVLLYQQIIQKYDSAKYPGMF